MDAIMFNLGMIVVPGIANKFATASSSKGIGALGPAAVIIRLFFFVITGFTHKDKIKA